MTNTKPDRPRSLGRLFGGAVGFGIGILAGLGLGGRNSFGEYVPRSLPGTHSTVSRLPVEGRMPSLDGATSWLDFWPRSPNDLRGKVVIVEFWTYTCINWRRQLPYVRAWAQRYREQGLVVIGVHSPEFPFERDPERVKRAVAEMRIDYPVAIDSDHKVWNAFRNAYWPALYFIDAEGQIRHHQFGEGDYEESERVIRELLAEANGRSVDGPFVSVDPEGAEAQPDWENLQSGENYLGYDRMQRFASPDGVKRDVTHPYSVPSTLRPNHWALSGTWTIGSDSAVSNADGRFVVRFHARDLHLVMGSQTGAPVRFRVRIDGQVPTDARGLDVDANGEGTITEPRMYQLIRQSALMRERTFELELLDPGVELYSISFG